MLGLFLIAVMLFISVLFRLASALRLSIPLAYALIVPTIFHEWFYAHQALAEGIWYAMLVLTAISWGITLIRKIRFG